MFTDRRSDAGRSKSVVSRGRRRPRRPQLEGLEKRELLANGDATIWTVNSTKDTGTGTGQTGDLLYCITSANADTNPAGDVIHFDPTVFAKPKTITVKAGELQLTNTFGPEIIGGQTYDVTIAGGKGTGPIISVAEGVAAEIYNITISGGSAATTGAGVSTDGQLSIVNTTISGNAIKTTKNGTAPAGGAGIFNGPDGYLTLTNDEVINNTITNPTNAGNPASGAGIDNLGYLSMYGSTVSGNSISNGTGGGIANSGMIALINDTVASNTTTNGGSGAGLESTGGVSAINATIAYNASQGTSGAAGGILGTSGSVVLQNTIVALNTTGSGRKAVASDVVASTGVVDLIASGYDLIGTGGSGGLTAGTNGNLVGVSNTDVGLGTLASNGGLTQTIALAPTSLALGAGDVSYITDSLFGTPPTDQRGTGYARVVSGQVDIGAYETQPAS